MKKCFQTIALLAMFSACLFGCGKQELDRPSDVGENAGVSYDISKTESTAFGKATGNQHVTQVLGENLSMDAEAVIPEKNEYSTYTLKMVDCDPDRLFGLFCSEDYGSYTTEEHGNYLVYDEASGKQLAVYEDAIAYSAYDNDSPMQIVENLMYYYSEDYPQTEPHDLSFINVEEMEKKGTEILDQLGVAWEPRLLRCITLSGQEILDFQEEMLQNSRYTEFEVPPILTEATDTCYLQFNFAYDGIPLLGFEEPVADSYVNSIATWNVNATIMFNADGIQTCNVSYPCTIVHAFDPQPILDLEEAIALLQEKYDLQIVCAPLEFTNIWMEYIPIKQDEEVVLTPYWCFLKIDKKALDFPNYFGDADRFNSITGKDLAYGG